jgi:DNA repair protein RecO (recombination protein O)
MPIVTTPATILKTYEYSETSKILRLFTRDQGLCSAIAKGARRPKSRFGGLLEPFTDGVATFYAKEGRELHTLSAFELQKERQILGRELLRFAGAGLLAEMVLRFAPAAPDRELFYQLRRGFDRLVEDRADAELIILEENWRLVTQLGFAPSVDHCSICLRLLSAAESADFDLQGGGIICQRCRPGAVASSLRPLTCESRRELAALVGASSGREKLGTARFQLDLLRDFVAHHLADHRSLNSFHFLEERLP